jgi:hypothetical protein
MCMIAVFACICDVKLGSYMEVVTRLEKKRKLYETLEELYEKYQEVSLCTSNYRL